MRLSQLMDALEGYLADELEAQRRLGEHLERQEAAVLARDTEAIRAATDALEAELGRQPHREGRRKDLVAGFARTFGVAAEVLTVRSILERAAGHGAGCERADELRGELRAAVVEVRRRARKLGVVARGHSELLTDVIRALVGETRSESSGGILVDAEA